MNTKTRRTIVVAASAVMLILAALSISRVLQAQSYTAAGTWTTALPGWGAQAWHEYHLPGPVDDLASWDGFACEAFRYAPSGSFLEASDEDVALKFTATVYAREEIADHAIPLDVAARAHIFVDGIKVYLSSGSSTHTVAHITIPQGSHVIDIIADAGEDWTVLGVGECLWGTDPRIEFVKAGR